MEEDASQMVLTLMWPKIIFRDHEPESAALPAIESVYVTGSIVSSQYCAVERRWHMLVAGDDGQMYDITNDQEGLIQSWTTVEVGE
jgi:hypothetical protein